MTTRDLVPTGRPYGERKQTEATLKQAGVSVSPPSGPPGGQLALPPPAAKPNPMRPAPDVPDDPLLALSPSVPFARTATVAESLEMIVERSTNPLLRLAAARLRERS